MFSKAKRFQSPAKPGQRPDQRRGPSGSSTTRERTRTTMATVSTTTTSNRKPAGFTRTKSFKEHSGGAEARLPMTERTGEAGNQEKALLTFLTTSIQEKEEIIRQKEADLECPVCLEIPAAGARIFSCTQQHLVCSNCWPRVSQCPQCRKRYPPTPIRHRFAERGVGELEKLRLEKLKLKREQRKLEN